MSAFQKATNEQIIAAYKDTGSVWAAAKRLGMCGQSVWERLKTLGYDMTNQRWTEEEFAELEALAGAMPLGEIASRLGRPYGSVASQISARGLAHRGQPRAAKIPRGAGYDKATTQKHIKALEAYKGSIRQFCRANGLYVESFMKAVQRHFPEWWDSYVATHAPLPMAKCEYCEQPFYPMSSKQKTCNRKCQADLRADKKYFGGNRRNTIGMKEGICQLCRQHKTSALASHHLYGKENDPDNQFLVALCSGCHKLVEFLAVRKFVDNPEILQDMISLALCKAKAGKTDSVGAIVYVEIDEYQDEEQFASA